MLFWYTGETSLLHIVDTGDQDIATPLLHNSIEIMQWTHIATFFLLQLGNRGNTIVNILGSAVLCILLCLTLKRGTPLRAVTAKPSSEVTDHPSCNTIRYLWTLQLKTAHCASFFPFAAAENGRRKKISGLVIFSPDIIPLTSPPKKILLYISKFSKVWKERRNWLNAL